MPNPYSVTKDLQVKPSSIRYQLSKIYIENQREIKRSIDEINRIIELKRFWRDRATHKRALEFKNIGLREEDIKL